MALLKDSGNYAGKLIPISSSPVEQSKRPNSLSWFCLSGAWEANLTMGTEWPYKPTNETYKSGQQLIRTLI